MATPHTIPNQFSGTLGGIVGSQITIYYESHICEIHSKCNNRHAELQYQCMICGKRWK